MAPPVMGKKITGKCDFIFLHEMVLVLFQVQTPAEMKMDTKKCRSLFRVLVCGEMYHVFRVEKDMDLLDGPDFTPTKKEFDPLMNMPGVS